MIARVIIRPSAGCMHMFHRFATELELDDLLYERCLCGTRKVTIWPPAIPDTHWLLHGVFASESRPIVPSNA